MITVSFAVSCFVLHKRHRCKVHGVETMQRVANNQQPSPEPQVFSNEQNDDELHSATENAITETEASAETDNNSTVQGNPSALPPVPIHPPSVTSSPQRSMSMPIGFPSRRVSWSSSLIKSSVPSGFIPLDEDRLLHLAQGKTVASEPEPYYIRQPSEGFNIMDESVKFEIGETPDKADSTFETNPATAFPTKVRNRSITGTRQRSQSVYSGSPPSGLLRNYKAVNFMQRVSSFRKSSVSSSVDLEEEETLLSAAHNEKDDNHLGTGVQADDHSD